MKKLYNFKLLLQETSYTEQQLFEALEHYIHCISQTDLSNFSYKYDEVELIFSDENKLIDAELTHFSACILIAYLDGKYKSDDLVSIVEDITTDSYKAKIKQYQKELKKYLQTH